MASDGLSVLVVEDDETTREVLTLRLRDWGHTVEAVATAEEARELLGPASHDVLVADVMLPDDSGLELLKEVGGDGRGPEIVVVTAHGSIDLAVDAMKRGARDFLTKPLDTDKLRSILQEVAGELDARNAIRALESRLEEEAGLGSLVGASAAMKEIFEAVRLLAGNEASAILTGESGTGKEVVARTIHELSGRSEGPFVAVNAAAIPEGLIESELFGHVKGAFTGATSSRPGCFELADGGTLLLDEIGEMPPGLQPKLLRILEEGSVRRVGGSREVSFDARVLASTNRDPEAAIEAGALREDLFYRLNVFHLELPPLRERPEDIPLLCQHFVRLFSEKHDVPVEGFREASLELLGGYSWPGNVRELRNVVERAVIVAGDGLVDPSHLPPFLRDEEPVPAGDRVSVPVGTTAAEAEKRLILQTLDHTGWNKAEAARQLDLDPKTIRNKLKRWGVEEPDESDAGG